MDIALRFDMRNAPTSVPRELRYAASVEMAEWADARGFDLIKFMEHHGAPDGYNPSPIVLASAVAARTARVRLRFSVLLLSMHHPLRVAEDLAVLDLISQGRVEVTAGAGYVPHEFAMFGLDIADRAKLLEENILTLRQAWTGEPFEFRGTEVRVTPRPYRDRMIPIYVGGSSPLAARIAARIGDGFEPTGTMYIERYIAACAAIGKEPGWTSGPRHDFTLLHISEDPDRTWARMAPFAAHESSEYAKLGAEPRLFSSAEDLEKLREPGRYTIVTPDEAVELLTRLGPGSEINFSPLMGGMDPELGWESLELLANVVLPRLEEAGVRQPYAQRGHSGPGRSSGADQVLAR